MHFKKANFLFVFLLFCLGSCVKYAGTATTTTNTKDSITSIKFFNVVDQGKLVITLNGSIITDSLKQYYPTSYITALADSNNLQLALTKSPDTTILNVNIGLIKGYSYSCFIYKLNYDWKISLVRDILTTPDSNSAGIRILDFRTQAATDFVSINLFSLGFETYGGVYPFIYRHFLDHESFDFLTLFTQVVSDSSYHIVVFNSSSNLSTHTSVNLTAKKLYSIIMMTPYAITADSTADKYIFTDVEQHN